MPIDFTSILRGQRTARADIRADQLARRQDEEFNFRAEQRRRELQESDWGREAAAYTAPLLTNMQRAADAGQSDLDFLIQQRNVVMQDPAFQAMSPEVQQQVLKRLGEAAQLTAQQYSDAGDLSSVRKLYGAFGWGGQVPERDIAFQSGDVNEIVKRIDPTGTLLQPVGDGTYKYLPTGTIMRGDEIAATAAQGGGAQVLPMLSNSIAMREEQRKAAELQQYEALRLMMYRENFVEQPDGTWKHQITGEVRPPLPVPGSAATPGVSPASAVTPPGGTVPAVTPPVVATPAVPTAPVFDPTPTIAQITATREKVPQLTLTVETLRAERDQMLRTLDQMAPMVNMHPGRQRVPRDPRTRGVVQALEARLADADDKLVEAETQLKTATNHLLPDQMTALTGQTAGASWAPQMLDFMVTPASTRSGAVALVRQSPAAAQSQLAGIHARLNALAGSKTPEAQLEVVKLITARDNLEAALQGLRPAGGGR